MDFDEMQIEAEKLKLEREKLALERERLETAKERLQAQQRAVHSDATGKLFVPLSTLLFVSFICLLGGGILGAFSASMSAEQREKDRLHDVMQTLASSGAPDADSATNAPGAVTSQNWMKMLKPKGAYSGVSLVVIKGPAPLFEKTEKQEQGKGKQHE